MLLLSFLFSGILLLFGLSLMLEEELDSKTGGHFSKMRTLSATDPDERKRLIGCGLTGVAANEDKEPPPLTNCDEAAGPVDDEDLS